MVKIKIKDLYPFVTEDTVVEVSKEVAEFIESERKKEKASREKIRRNKAYYSLDRNDGIEFNNLKYFGAKENIFEEELKISLKECLGKLPDKQKRRIIAYYFNGYTLKEIGEIEDVSVQAISKSIQKGIKRMQNLMNCR